MERATGTVFVIEDAFAARLALARLLAAGGYGVCIFESAEQFLTEPNAADPGCLLLDVFMPRMSGIELQCELIDSSLARPIVFLSDNDDIRVSVRAMKLGAVDFLTKPIDRPRLFAALDRALLRDSAQRSERSLRSMIEQRFGRLTLREREVMMHVAYGRLNKQIAARMGIGEKTIKVHRARVMRKMCARSVAELVDFGRRIGIALEPTLNAATQKLDWRQNEIESLRV